MTEYKQNHFEEMSQKNFTGNLLNNNILKNADILKTSQV